jgi:hypothetical protein
MKINKLFLMAGLAVMSLMATSCSSDDDNYTPGKEAGANDVTFADGSNITLEFTATSFDIVLKRSNTTSALEVPLKVVKKPDFLTVPATASFAAGAETAVVTCTVGSDMEAFVNYEVAIDIDEEYTNPYKETNSFPRYQITLVKEDYKLFASGVFKENILFKDSWPQEIEYSPLLDMFRMKNVFVPGGNWYFHWNQKGGDDSQFSFCNSEGKNVTKFASGYVHTSYGSITANVLGDYWMGYDADDNAFYFRLEFTVSAGSFGSNYDTISDVVFY